MTRTYDIFSGHDLEIADRIQLLRLNMLVHSCIYYKLNGNVITDMQWDSMAKELVKLQHDYPNIAEKVCWHDAFSDWDGSTGMDLPLDDPWVLNKAAWLFGGRGLKPTITSDKIEKVETTKTRKPKIGRLF